MRKIYLLYIVVSIAVWAIAILFVSVFVDVLKRFGVVDVMSLVANMNSLLKIFLFALVVCVMLASIFGLYPMLFQASKNSEEIEKIERTQLVQAQKNDRNNFGYSDNVE